MFPSQKQNYFTILVCNMKVLNAVVSIFSCGIIGESCSLCGVMHGKPLEVDNMAAHIEDLLRSSTNQALRCFWLY